MSKPAFIYGTYPAAAAFTASSSAAGTDADNVRFATEDTLWSPTGESDCYLYVDAGGAVPFDTFAFLGAGLDGVSLTINAGNDGVTYPYVAFVTLSGNITAWESVTGDTYRYFRYHFSGYGSDFAIAHVLAATRSALPYMSADPDPNRITPQGKHLTSFTGLYLGASQQSAVAKMPIDFGKVLDAEYTDAILPWADACVRTMRPFFFVPDTAAADCRFGYADPGQEFSAPLVNGIRKVSRITFIARVV